MNNHFQNAFNHLRKDRVLNFLIEKFGNDISIRDRFFPNYAKAISELIIEQQISFKAAISIKKKYNKIIAGLSDEQIIELDENVLREAGISRMKINYIKNVYIFFLDYNEDFNKLSNEEIIKLLSSIKGVGSWTSEMFLIFVLFRENVFSKKDLALINSIKYNYNLKNLDDKKLNNLIKSWSPYNSIASLLLWKSIEKKIFYQA